MAVKQEISTPVYPEHLLETIQQRLPLPFRLSVHCLENAPGDKSPIFESCGMAENGNQCDKGCLHRLHEAVFRAIEEQKAAVFRCPEGMLNFAAPFWDERNRVCCVLGTGIREISTSGERPDIRPLPKKKGPGGKSPVGEGISTPAAEVETVEAAAGTVHEVLQAVLKKNPYARTLEKANHQLRILNDVSAEIETCQTSRQVFDLITETLAVLFDLEAIGSIVPDGEGAGFSFQNTNGKVPGQLQDGAVRNFLKENPSGALVSLDDTRNLFSGEEKRPAKLLPLADGEKSLGLLVLFGGTFLPRDQLLVELLGGRAASRLARLTLEERSRREHDRKERLLNLICDLSLVKNRQDLYRKTVDSAADLLGAARGSLMLVDDRGENLVMVAAKGMSESLARNMTVPMGTSIAGRVAGNGAPLLVANIEKDQRLATSNRPRFRTKSFLSVPLILREQTIGVLNLADKDEEEPFNQEDLDLVMSLAGHVASMTERANVFEKAGHMEELAITDPLTGIYNRRFLEKRLEEELNRSSRHRLEFTVMLLDLDHFKPYNDLVGHLGGDRALQKSAELLRNSAREMDIVTRYGGEEFCIILPGTSKRESIFVADRIRRAVENEPFPQEKSLPNGNLTVSIGLATFPRDGETSVVLLQSADRALYHAKETGRNRIVLSEPPTNEKFGRKLG